MLQEFKKFIEENSLFNPKESILLAVSGGIDSMVLCDLFLQSGYKFSIAHCNFHLRDEESNRDEKFVTDYAIKNNITLHKKDFDTYAYMAQTGKSLQMAARDLRYEWFKGIMEENNYSYLATGHHADDSIETFLINLLRGTGIAGLHGILPKTNHIIRPMLFCNREKISKYAQNNNISFVEDSSNASVKYTRNKIRHELVPLLKEITPNFERTLLKEIERFRETEEIFRNVINEVKADIFIFEDNQIKIPIDKIKKLVPQKIYMYELLSEYNFNETTIYNICDNLDNIAGKQFFSETHRLIKDREYLIIAENTKEISSEYFIEKDITSIKTPISMQIELLKDLAFVKIPKSKDIAMLDADKLSFPLVLRKWKKGDFFVPYGMKVEKKISDFYTNLKYSLFDKEAQWLLCSGEDIVWVVGQRIDERYKITNETKTIYKLEIDE